ncbi:substrate-binding domain-containing protein [Methylobacterium sp. WSM2598]|uniref:substrate-binding domain-containing protein n=1 Tax=Methylobacterium sp. WSM2598 TaxID=398261 RepID=UPI00036BD3A3|nr:substrate-binding domain-containing protein [Methylobacterium sp. WSM2598]
MTRSNRGGVAALGLAAMMVMTGPSHAAEIHVLVSGAFTGAFRTIVPRFEQASGHTLILSWGPSFGTTKDALPVRIAAGEDADVLLIVGSSLDKLVAEGRFVPASRTAIAQSRIGVGVKTGATKPDVSSIDALRQALLAAGSIGYSEGASGVFVSTDLLKRLGIADRVAGKMRKITGELVGEAVARGEVELGIQQVSELLSVGGVDFVGPLPDEVQKASPMTAAVSEKSKQIEAAKEFVAFLSTPDARQDLKRSGLDPLTTSESQPSR